MKNFNEWFSCNEKKSPWLIIGKGPSFNKTDKISLGDYQTIALNHVITAVKCDIVHMADLDVLDGIEESVEENAKFLLLPFYPHIDQKPGDKSLEQLVPKHTFLRKMSNEGRLLWYNSSLAKSFKAGYPVITVCYFSADAVVSLLASVAVKEIFSAGLDGGRTYGDDFLYLKEKTMLINQQKSFDAQFIAIANVLENTGGKLLPLFEKTIRIFVGTEENQWLATKVLEFSIKLRTSASVEVFPLYQANISVPTPQNEENHPRTPFSFQRFLIPELCDFDGRAIYLDSDMQVFTDIRELAGREMNGQEVLSSWVASSDGRRPQFSVMLLNCALLPWDIKRIIKDMDEGKLTYEELMYEMKIAKRIGVELEAEWNSLEFFDEGKTKLLHYTDMNKQPWLFRNNPNADIWVKELFNAIQLGYLSKRDVKRQILLGNIRPTLLYQIRKEVFNPLDIPSRVRWIDKLFKPPHQQTKIFWKNSLSIWLRGGVSLGLIAIFGGRW